ncbi:MAG: P-loop NTPase [Eubacteriales bacterium]|jgi:Mrp family chromosome partitioning ATPase
MANIKKEEQLPQQPRPDENCSHDCSTCATNCPSRTSEQTGAKKTTEELMQAPLNHLSSVKKVIAVVSGKGGVGKSLVTSMLATATRRRGYNTAIMDADITGPSIPKIFGLPSGNVQGNDDGMFPPTTKTGIEVMSVNLLLPDEKTPVIWRGPIIAGTVKQFWTDVIWNDVDFMFIDMPPGTGDVPLTVFQSIPVDGVIIVTSPQELVSMIVSKAVKMAEIMKVPVLGIIENYSYALCPKCGEKIEIFGASRVNEVAAEFGLEVLDRIPVDPNLAALCDKGMIELMKDAHEKYVEHAADFIEAKALSEED